MEKIGMLWKSYGISFLGICTNPVNSHRGSNGPIYPVKRRSFFMCYLVQRIQLWRRRVLKRVVHPPRVCTGYEILEKLWNFEIEIPYMEKLWNLSKTAVPMERLWNVSFGGKKCLLSWSEWGENTSLLLCGLNFCCFGYHFTSFTNLPGYSASQLLGRVNTR